MKKFIAILFIILLVNLSAPKLVEAARIWSSGFELGSTAEDVEYNQWIAAGAIETTTKRTGVNSLKVALTGSNSRRGGYIIPFIGSAHSFFRAYVYFETLPPAVNSFMLSGNDDASINIRAKIDNAGQLSLVDEDGSIGTGSTLSTGVWYRIELESDTTVAAGSHVVNLYVDGVLDIGSSTRSISKAQDQFYFVGNGNTEAHTSGIWYFDDLAINNTSGSSQTSLPGAGGIIHMQPDSAGDADETLGSFADIDEVTPNDATDYIEVDTNIPANYNFESWSSAGGASNDTITLVHVGTRQHPETAASGAWTPQIKSQSGGTTASGSSTTHDDTTWQTNQDSAFNRSYRLTSYTDPQAGGAWTPALLDTMIAGVNVTDADPDMFFSTIWALVEYTEAVATPPSSISPPPSTTGLRFFGGLRFLGGLIFR
ncbi:MAG TPA: hypothetical protein VJC12_03685 [Candidatus Paceibacterota bacterium]